GASTYRVIAVKLEPQPLITMRPIKYPASQMYFFKPLNERTPVYEKPFQLLQDIELDGTPPAQAALRGRDSITVNGALEYQACDDKVCFNPESVPLSWTLTVRPIVRDQTVPRR